MRAYPNPVDGPVYLVYTEPESAQRVHLRIMDALGRTVQDLMLAPKTGITEVQTTAWSNGLYVAGLFVDDVPVGTVKLIANR